jgi:hypothetical protein
VATADPHPMTRRFNQTEIRGDRSDKSTVAVQLR